MVGTRRSKSSATNTTIDESSSSRRSSRQAATATTQSPKSAKKTQGTPIAELGDEVRSLLRSGCCVLSLLILNRMTSLLFPM